MSSEDVFDFQLSEHQSNYEHFKPTKFERKIIRRQFSEDPLTEEDRKQCQVFENEKYETEGSENEESHYYESQPSRLSASNTLNYENVASDLQRSGSTRSERQIVVYEDQKSDLTFDRQVSATKVSAAQSLNCELSGTQTPGRQLSGAQTSFAQGLRASFSQVSDIHDAQSYELKLATPQLSTRNVSDNQMTQNAKSLQQEYECQASGPLISARQSSEPCTPPLLFLDKLKGTSPQSYRIDTEINDADNMLQRQFQTRMSAIEAAEFLLKNSSKQHHSPLRPFKIKDQSPGCCNYLNKKQGGLYTSGGPLDIFNIMGCCDMERAIHENWNNLRDFSAPTGRFHHRKSCRGCSC